MNIGWEQAKGMSKFKQLLQKMAPRRHRSIRYSTNGSSNNNNNDLSMITESGGTPQIKKFILDIKTNNTSNELYSNNKSIPVRK